MSSLNSFTLPRSSNVASRTLINERTPRVVKTSTIKVSSNVQVFLIIITFLEYIGIEKGKIAALAALEEQEQDIIRLFLAQFCGNIRVLKLAFRLDEWT